MNWSASRANKAVVELQAGADPATLLAVSQLCSMVIRYLKNELLCHLADVMLCRNRSQRKKDTDCDPFVTVM